MVMSLTAPTQTPAPSIFEQHRWIVPVLIILALYLILKGKGQVTGVSQVSNSEVIEWVDYRGVNRKLTIHRNVTAS